MSPSSPPPIPQTSPPDRVFRKQLQRRVFSLLALMLYAGFFRWLFGTDLLKGVGGVVALSFVFGVPFSLGVLSVALERWSGSDEWLYGAIIAPSIVLTFGLLLCFLTGIEAVICIIMASPLLYSTAWAGGLLTHLILPRNIHKNRLHMTFAVFLPLLAVGAESSLHWPMEIKGIENTIVIHAPAEKIWPQIASVSTIRPDQIPNRWIYRVGFPKPISATLDHPGVGGLRTATFERGVSFYEKVTSWNPPYQLAFTIHADPDFIPHTAFDQHIIVGGRFYNVLDGIYQIEPISPSLCRLHLTSHHRLSTRFNAYAGWWSERVMDDIQSSILEVIRQRAESSARTIDAMAESRSFR